MQKQISQSVFVTYMFPLRVAWGYFACFLLFGSGKCLFDCRTLSFGLVFVEFFCSEVFSFSRFLLLSSVFFNTIFYFTGMEDFFFRHTKSYTDLFQ